MRRKLSIMIPFLRPVDSDKADLKLHISTMRHLWFLDHYYRHLYRIFKYIDDVDSSTVSQSKKKELCEFLCEH